MSKGNLIDFTQPILNLRGESFEERQQLDADGAPISGTGTGITLGTVCARALSGIFKDEENLQAEKKLQRGQLALKIFVIQEPIGLKAEEVALIKRLVARMYNPIIIARAFPMLDPGEETK